MLERVARWALGMYPPSVPDDIRLTDVRSMDAGRSEIVGRVTMSLEDAAKIRRHQERHHGISDHLQALTSEYEVEVLERSRRHE